MSNSTTQQPGAELDAFIAATNAALGSLQSSVTALAAAQKATAETVAANQTADAAAITSLKAALDAWAAGKTGGGTSTGSGTTTTGSGTTGTTPTQGGSGGGGTTTAPVTTSPSGLVMPPDLGTLPAGALMAKRFDNAAAIGAGRVMLHHTFKPGALPAGSGLVASNGWTVQVDAKTAWPDGSVLSAVLTVEYPAQSAAGEQVVTFAPGTASGAALDLATAIGSHTLTVTVTPTAPVAPATTNRLTAPFTVDLIAALKAETAPMIWRSGPLAVSTKVAVLGADPQGVMSVTGYVSFYADGTMDAKIVVGADVVGMLPNAWPTGGGQAYYAAAIDCDGAATDAGPVADWIGGKWTVNVGSQTGIVVVNDPMDYMLADCSHPFALSGVSPSKLVKSLTPYAPMGNTTTCEYMGTTGGRPDIGPHEEGTVTAMVTQDLLTRQQANATARVNGSIQWHITNKATGQPWTPYDATPDNLPIWMTPSNASSVCLPNPGIGGGSPWKLDQAHFPELVYLEYLQGLEAGHPYYLDELIATTYGMVLAQWPGQKRGATNDVIVGIGEQVRGCAWTLRNIDLAAFITPTAHPQKSNLVKMMGNNIAALNALPATQVGVELTGYLSGAYGTPGGMAPWQQDYADFPLMMMARHGWPGMSEFMNWRAKWTVGRFFAGPQGFAPENGFAYDLAYYKWSAGQQPQSASELLATYAEVETATLAENQSNVDATGAIISGWPHAQGDYCELAAFSLANAAGMGLAGAQTALTWILGIGAPAMDATSLSKAPYFNPAVVAPSGGFAMGEKFACTYAPPISTVQPMTVG
ncbi:MAG: hypothetical protein PHZ23_15925 [Acidiphilium sp.]|nr:hypothetical protein [Acidiphilium sp.]